MAPIATPRRLRRRNVATTVTVGGAAALAIAAAAGHFQLEQDASAAYTPDAEASPTPAPESPPEEPSDDEGDAPAPASVPLPALDGEGDGDEPGEPDDVDDFNLDFVPGADLGEDGLDEILDRLDGDDPSDDEPSDDDPADEPTLETPDDIGDDVAPEAAITELASDVEELGADLAEALSREETPDDGADEPVADGDEPAPDPDPGGDADEDATLEERIAAWFADQEDDPDATDPAPGADESEDEAESATPWCDLDDPNPLFDAVVFGGEDAIAFEALLAECDTGAAETSDGEPTPTADEAQDDADPGVPTAIVEPLTTSFGR